MSHKDHGVTVRSSNVEFTGGIEGLQTRAYCETCERYLKANELREIVTLGAEYYLAGNLRRLSLYVRKLFRLSS